MKCTRCGNELADGALFCNQCGTEVPKEEHAVTEQSKTEKKSFKWKDRYTIFALIGAITIAALIGYAVKVSKNKEAYEETEKEFYEEVEIEKEQDQEKEEQEKEVEAEQEQSTTMDSHVSKITKEHIRAVTATSYLEEPQYELYHTPDRVLDGNLGTAWVENAEGQGINEAITIEFDGVCMVEGININAGHQMDEDLYFKNSRPKEIFVEFSDGSGESYFLEDVMKKQSIQFFQETATESITIRILSVYPGNKYEDTVISEIALY